MWDANSNLFYDLFDANEFHAGVSGSGQAVEMSLPRVKKALAAYKKLKEEDFVMRGNPEFIVWHRNEMLKFINSCLETAKKEGKVTVVFA
ncbi:hypothetical protein [Virgibacillus doumboii]|uniref:hypothetical protein n=1 Tax=Virgibacillus doumboii TaxID=2697503 RepID=UPI001FE7E0BB|nr:hypothetical protein [Virgibacillus doumboii]